MGRNDSANTKRQQLPSISITANRTTGFVEVYFGGAMVKKLGMSPDDAEKIGHALFDASRNARSKIIIPTGDITTRQS